MRVPGKALLFLIWLLPVIAVLWSVRLAPDWLEPRRLTVDLAPGSSLILGRNALLAPQADSEHIALRRTPEGGWQLSNIAPAKQVLWRPAQGRDDRPTREWPLTAGAAFSVGEHRFEILTVSAESVTLHAEGQRWTYDGLRLRRADRSLPECSTTTRSGLRDQLMGWGLGRLMERPLRLGGGVYCADRLGLSGIPVDTAQIAPVPGGFALRPGPAGRLDGVPVTVAADTAAAESLWRRPVPLEPGDQLIIGRTRYQIRQTTPLLELAVLTRAGRQEAAAPSVAQSTGPAPSEVRVDWQALTWLKPAALKTLPQDLFWPLVLGLPWLMLGVIWPGRPRHWPDVATRWSIALGLGLAGACLGLHLTVLAVPLLWPYLLAWPALLIGLWSVASPFSAALLITLTMLLGSGLLALLQLGVGAAESGWSRYGGSGAALSGAIGWLAWAGVCYWRWRRPDPWQSAQQAVWGLRLLSGVGLGLLLIQALFGDEGGWGGFQPFELTKLALLMAAAYALMRRARLWGRDWSFAKSPLWLLYLGPVTLLLAASTFALVFLHDFSPLVLLGLGSLTLAWAYLRGHPQPGWRWGGGAVLWSLIVLIGLGLGWLHERPEDFPLDLQSDRVRVWAAPEQYPHSGYQLRRALDAIRAGGWWGTAWDGGSNGISMAIPVVESDFMPSFFLSRYGGVAGMVLVGAQTALVLWLLIIAGRARHWTQRGDYQLAALGYFCYFTLYGGAALLGAHFVVSWGSNLGFLPVMGQPMPLLSAAGSHWTLFVLPLLALAVAVEEESHDHAH